MFSDYTIRRKINKKQNQMIIMIIMITLIIIINTFH